MKKSQTVCFTGRRAKKLCGWKHESYKTLVAHITEVVKNLADMGYTDFISGGTQGFDQLAFWAVHKAKTEYKINIQNHVFIPFEGQESAWPENGCFGQKEYRQMLKLTDSVTVCGTKDNIGRQLTLRNHAMVDASSLLVALYDSDDNFHLATFGGTEECMRYAYSKDIKIQILDYIIQNNKIELL